MIFMNVVIYITCPLYSTLKLKIKTFTLIVTNVLFKKEIHIMYCPSNDKILFDLEICCIFKCKFN